MLIIDFNIVQFSDILFTKSVAYPLKTMKRNDIARNECTVLS